MLEILMWHAYPLHTNLYKMISLRLNTLYQNLKILALLKTFSWSDLLHTSHARIYLNENHCYCCKYNCTYDYTFLLLLWFWDDLSWLMQNDQSSFHMHTYVLIYSCFEVVVRKHQTIKNILKLIIRPVSHLVRIVYLTSKV